MKFHQQGLNMIEMVMTLVVLAILASTAIPSFVEKRTENRATAVAGVAGSLDSASAINFTVRSINSNNGVAITNCVDVAAALEGSLSSEYIITPAPIRPGTTQKCRVTHRNRESAEFIGHGIS
ncbi:MAG TPA: prepilin-type N-terminal cleavage/methylation domain-containing protein [Gammaproteobacteria bacterium]